MEQSKVQDFIKALVTKGVRMPCPRCGNQNFAVVAESIIFIQSNPAVLSIGGPSIPTVVIVCDKCGYVTQHAKLVLENTPATTTTSPPEQARSPNAEGKQDV